MTRTHRYKAAIVVNLILSVLALVAAYIMEYFGVLPCRLCIYQRMVYYAVIILNGAVLLLIKTNTPMMYGTANTRSGTYALWAKMACINTQERDYPNAMDANAMLCMILTLFILLGGVSIAVFQLMIENNLISYDSPCTTNFFNLTSPQALLSAIRNKDLIPCDKPQMVVLGISLSGWNGIYMLFLCTVSLLILRWNNNKKLQ